MKFGFQNKPFWLALIMTDAAIFKTNITWRGGHVSRSIDKHASSRDFDSIMWFNQSDHWLSIDRWSGRRQQIERRTVFEAYSSNDQRMVDVHRTWTNLRWFILAMSNHTIRVFSTWIFFGHARYNSFTFVSADRFKDGCLCGHGRGQLLQLE